MWTEKRILQVARESLKMYTRRILNPQNWMTVYYPTLLNTLLQLFQFVCAKNNSCGCRNPDNMFKNKHLLVFIID